LVMLAARHYKITDALRSRDPERAAQAMHDHIMELVEILRQRKGRPSLS